MKILALCLIAAGCAPAAYEIIPGARRAPGVVEVPGGAPQPSPPAPAPQQAPAPAPAPIPPVQQSEPPIPIPTQGKPGGPVQQEPPMCNEITVCSRTQLPACNKPNAGVFAYILGTGLFRCSAGQWVAALPGDDQ